MRAEMLASRKFLATPGDNWYIYKSSIPRIVGK